MGIGGGRALLFILAWHTLRTARYRGANALERRGTAILQARQQC